MKNYLATAATLALTIIGATTLAAADGKALYDQHCAKCHGADGKGETKMGKKLRAKDYSSAKTWEALKDSPAVKAIKDGVKDKDGKVVMKPTEGVTDTEATAIIDYMKTLKK